MSESILHFQNQLWSLYKWNQSYI